MHSFLQLIDTLDTDNRARGVQFEKLCKWLLENHPLYKSKLKQVWLWDDWPERWGKDCGIDLVAEDRDERLGPFRLSAMTPNTVSRKRMLILFSVNRLTQRFIIAS